jgi:Zn-dependent protease
VLARCDASPDTATRDRSWPTAPASARPVDRLSCGSPRINRTLRAFATITSCPNSLSKRLIQGECVPISSAIRLRGIAPKTSSNPFAVVRTRCSNCICPASSSTQYQLLRSPRSSPMVSCCCEIFLLCFVATVLTFFIAGLLFICALSTSITWERTPHPVRRPAFSSHLLSRGVWSYAMSALRKLLSSVFGISCLICIPIALGSIVRTVHGHNFISRADNALVSAIFVGTMIVFALACMAGWRKKSSARGWGIAASALYVLIPVWSMIRLSRPLWGPYGIPLATGVAGVIAFSWPYEESEPSEKDHELFRIPGDRTSDLLNRVGQYLNVAATLAIYVWWVRWLRTTEVVQIYSRRYQLLLVLLVIFAITSLHEIGHVATGLTLGFDLQTLTVGPFQWYFHDDKWKFQFRLRGVLASAGAARMVPATSDRNRWRYLCILAGGPFVNLISGAVALGVALTANADAHSQAGGLTMLFGAWSLALGAINLIPLRSEGDYSDGASILQLLLEPGPSKRRLPQPPRISKDGRFG